MLLSKVIKSNSEKVKSRLDIACWMLIILNSHQDIPHLEAAAWLQGPWQPPPGRKDFPPSPRVCNEHTVLYGTVLYCTGSAMNTLRWLLCTLGLWQSRDQQWFVCCVSWPDSPLCLYRTPPPALLLLGWVLIEALRCNLSKISASASLCLYVEFHSLSCRGNLRPLSVPSVYMGLVLLPLAGEVYKDWDI